MQQPFPLFAVKQDENIVIERADDRPVVNVSSVPQRSLFRFPGGKTWLVPFFRRWMSQFDGREILFSEPFAGGGIISLTAAFENLANEIVMVEKDEDVGAVWKTILGKDGEKLAKQIEKFCLTMPAAQGIINKQKKTILERAFSTILRNRIYHGGILAKGSGMIKNGENGRGLLSRWYPETLGRRIRDIQQVKHKMEFIQGDAFEFIEAHKDGVDCVYFIDPPYVRAGRRLYTHFDVDHEKLFKLLSSLKGAFLASYDDAPQIRYLADKYSIPYILYPMKTTHHLMKCEILLSNVDFCQ